MHVLEMLDDCSWSAEPRHCGVYSPAAGDVRLDVWGEAERTAVKDLGAKYDDSRKTWFVPSSEPNIRERFHQWLPEVSPSRRRDETRARQVDPVAAAAAEHPGRVYIAAKVDDAQPAPPRLEWDADFAGSAGCYFVPPQLTADLAPWRDLLPCGVLSGGAAAAAADADVARVAVPAGAGLPPHTAAWVYFRGAGGALTRRRRRWARPGAVKQAFWFHGAAGRAGYTPEHTQAFVEKVTQQEYNRRVDAADWPTYKREYRLPSNAYEWHEVDYDLVDGDMVPVESGLPADVLPQVIIDRKQARRYLDGNLNVADRWEMYEPPARVARRRGQYRDKDQLVRAAPGADGGATEDDNSGDDDAGGQPPGGGARRRGARAAAQGGQTRSRAARKRGRGAARAAPAGPAPVSPGAALALAKRARRAAAAAGAGADAAEAGRGARRSCVALEAGGPKSPKEAAPAAGPGADGDGGLRRSRRQQGLAPR